MTLLIVFVIPFSFMHMYNSRNSNKFSVFSSSSANEIKRGFSMVKFPIIIKMLLRRAYDNRIYKIAASVIHKSLNKSSININQVRVKNTREDTF